MIAYTHKKINIEQRKPIWIALSGLYVDTELKDHDFKYIAVKIKESPYTIEQARQIDKKEVFPVLYPNLLAVTGVWSGFEEQWLISEISKTIRKRTWFSSFKVKLKYLKLKWMYASYWERLEKAYKKL